MLGNIPYQAITRLGNIIKNHKNALKVVVSINKTINFELFGKKCIFYLEEGNVSLHRKEDDLLILKFEAPFIIGIDQLFFDLEYHYIISNSNASLYLLSNEDAVITFDKSKLWKDIAHLITYTMRLNEHRSNNLVENKTIYDIIKIHLETIWELPKNERESISIFNYILKRHKISRSSIAKIVKELNNGKYITTRRGVLVNLNRLPSKF